MEKILLLMLLGTAMGVSEPTFTSEPETATEEVAELTVFEMEGSVQQQQVETTTTTVETTTPTVETTTTIVETTTPTAETTTPTVETTTHTVETTTRKKPDIICASYTPCKWVIFLHNAERDAWIMPMFQTRTRDLPNELYEKFMVHDEDVINKYCICGPGTVCTRMENVPYSGYEVYRCRPGTN